jgi:hypothetical protein
LGIVVPHLLQSGIRVLEARSREDPVEVRVREFSDVPAGRTRPATPLRARAPARPSAEETLSQPDRKTLLADSTRPLEEEARRQGFGAQALGEPLTQMVVSVKFNDWHIEI